MENKTFKIEINKSHHLGGVSRLKECVAKNFKEYRPEDLYEPDFMMGIFIKVDENDDFILCKSSLSYENTSKYFVCVKKNMSVCLGIELEHLHEIKLAGCKVILTITEIRHWTMGCYQINNPMYGVYPASADSFVNDIDSNIYPCCLRYQNKLYFTSMWGISDNQTNVNIYFMLK